jgi:predicted Ser/Thr protein kinase
MTSEVVSGRYQLDEMIGHGGMGVVYRAQDLRLKRTVALKMLPRELTDNPELRRRLAQEARAAACLSHSGIAAVYDFEEHETDSFIVYEYVEGLTLRSQIRPGNPTETILELGIQLSDALAAAHEHGIIHRDLKPENIMVKQEGGASRIKILDFGLAKLQPPVSPAPTSSNTPTESTLVNTALGLLVGTVNYMSPEQLEGEPVDAKADIYSLGLVLYEMATGINPFVGKTPTSTIANILKQEAPPVTERDPVAPLELDRILRKCLRKRPEERYQTARDLLVDLRNLHRGMVSGALSSSSAAVARPSPAPALTISRNVARGLFLLIQCGYLIAYAALFYNLQAVQALGGTLGSPYMVTLVILSALCGIPVRLYLTSASGFDYADLGLQYRRLFPAALLIDAAWAAAPILLLPKLGGLVLVFVAGLAYLPFSQRTLLYAAYSPHGGRISTARSAG